jgi:hypothetical protein
MDALAELSWGMAALIAALAVAGLALVKALRLASRG